MVLTREGLTSFDPATAAEDELDLPTAPDSLAAAADGESVWASHPRERALRRIEGDRVVCTVDVPSGSWSITVAEDGAVWLTGGGGNTREERLVRIDPTTTC